jgi:hypothetical protein
VSNAFVVSRRGLRSFVARPRARFRHAATSAEKRTNPTISSCQRNAKLTLSALSRLRVQGASATAEKEVDRDSFVVADLNAADTRREGKGRKAESA